MRKAPQAADEAVKRLSPLNLYGEPRFRLIHGSDCFTLVEGFFSDYSESNIFIRRVFEKRMLLKYPAHCDRWILEHWEPPEFWGTPEQWEGAQRQWEGGRGFNLCGPYPSRGDYRSIVRFTNRLTGAPIKDSELTVGLIEHIFSKIYMPTADQLKA